MEGTVERFTQCRVHHFVLLHLGLSLETWAQNYRFKMRSVVHRVTHLNGGVRQTRLNHLLNLISVHHIAPTLKNLTGEVKISTQEGIKGKREARRIQEPLKVKFRKMLGLPGPTRFGDPFGLLPLCQSLGLDEKARAILRSCRAAGAVDVAEMRSDLPHTASYLGGHPALPYRFPWPSSQSARPMRFVGQFACSELALAKLTSLPDEGLLSVFMDALDDEPKEAQVYHFSLTKDLCRQTPPPGQAQSPAFRAAFSTIPSLPRPGSLEYEALALCEDDADAYYQLLLELEEGLEPSPLRCSGHPPFSDEEGSYPDRGDPRDWEFFLALKDVEELELAWPETGCVMLWLPRSAERFSGKQTALSWQPLEVDWEEDETGDEDIEEECEED